MPALVIAVNLKIYEESRKTLKDGQDIELLVFEISAVARMVAITVEPGLLGKVSRARNVLKRSPLSS